MLSDNLHEVQENIRKACERSGRNPEDVTLIAVSKTKPVSDIEQIYAAGIREFGENKVQEMNDKQKVLPGDINWHMIGHLQRNKVKYIVDNVAMIHSVDSVRLAEEISKEAVKKNVAVDILVEVNVAKEESKFGLYTEDVRQFVEQISKLPGINIKGLMTSAPFVDNPEDNRQYFKKLKDLSVDINAKNIDNVHMDFLSMGMTNDYKIAIQEGANLVRIGSGIFGLREK